MAAGESRMAQQRRSSPATASLGRACKLLIGFCVLPATLTIAGAALTPAAERQPDLPTTMATVFSVLFAIEFLYLLPIYIALLRNVTGVAQLVAVNVLLGWSLAGWVAALVQAV